MKRKASMILGVLLVSALVGCGAAKTQPEVTEEAKAEVKTEATETTETKKKVLMTISNQQNEFIVGMGESFLQVGNEYGYDVQLMDANLDPTMQISQIETAIAQGASAIFVEPCSSEGLTAGLQEAKDAGIPVFTIHNGVSATDLITSAIRVDVKQGGVLKMQQAIDDIGGKGDIALMTGTLGQDTTNQICSGYDEILANYPDVNIVFEGAGNWGATDAAPLAENWLASGKKIDAIVCNNDGMALGVLPVLETADMVGKIKLYGLDATAEGLKAVQEDKMNATIFVNAEAEIRAAFTMVQSIEKGETVEKEFVVPAELVTKDNIGDYLK